MQTHVMQFSRLTFLSMYVILLDLAAPSKKFSQQYWQEYLKGNAEMKRWFFMQILDAYVNLRIIQENKIKYHI